MTPASVPEPPPPGRSALPSFRAWESGLAARVADAEAAAAARVSGAEAEAARIRGEGEERLKEVVVAAQQQALREVEGRARDRVSAARAGTQRWIEQAEEAARALLDDALDRCCGA